MKKSTLAAGFLMLVAACNLEIIDPVAPVFTFETRITGASGAVAGGGEVIQTTDTGYAVFGWTNVGSGSSTDFYVLKFDKKGVQQWARSFGSGGFDYAYSAFPIAAVGYIMGGESDGKFHISRIDASGSTIWAYAGETGYCISVIPTNDGNLLGVGNQFNTTTSGDILLVKLSLNGSVIWSRKINTLIDEQVSQVVAEPAGTFLLAGRASAPPTGSKVSLMLLRVDANGNEILRKNYTDSPIDIERANGLAALSDGGYAIVGDALDGNNNDILVQRVDNSLNVTWRKLFGGSGYDTGVKIAALANGDLAVLGAVSFSTYPATWLALLDPTGNERWVRTFNTSQFDEIPTAIRHTFDKGFVITGNTYEASGSQVLLIKTNPNGEL